VSDLRDLIDRARSADGYDEHLELQLAERFYGRKEAGIHESYYLAMHRYSESVDAVFGLAICALGHAATIHLTYALGGAFHACTIVMPEHEEPIVVENARTPALAVTIAVLEAVQRIRAATTQPTEV
jgi:Mn2+/Fe2+ NRAMP family transporter